MAAPDEIHQAKITLGAYRRKLARLDRDVVEQRRKVREQKELLKELQKKTKQ